MFKKFISTLVVSSLWLTGAAMAQTKQIKGAFNFYQYFYKVYFLSKINKIIDQTYLL